MKKVNSFDIFDTLIARNCRNPPDIFHLIEEGLPCKHFAALRMEAERIASYKHKIYMNIDHIYEEYKILNQDADIEKLKQAELDYEYENSIPILCNIQKIRPGDIYISDMYLKKEQIYTLLKKHNIPLMNELYVTNGGKHEGIIYEELKRTYQIELHTGDNVHSDIFMAQRYKIPAFHTTVSFFTETEKLLYDHKLFDLQKSIRTFRLKNPYPDGIESTLYNEQCQLNIPLLYLFCIHINEIMVKEKRKKVLFVTRDCCLLIQMFKRLFPFYETVYFSSSRYINKNPSPGYKDYVRSHYDPKCILVDLQGTFKSSMPLYWELFGDVPRVHFLSCTTQTTVSPKITASILPNLGASYVWIEHLNFDKQGTIFGMVEGQDIRVYNENDEYVVNLIHDIFTNYLDSMPMPVPIHNLSVVAKQIADQPYPKRFQNMIQPIE
jgi:hypothetical protein